jgi:alkylated DNA repair dioxygenase AlkB
MARTVAASPLPLFGRGDLAADDRFAGAVRHQLTPRSWFDHVPGWLSGSDQLFDHLVAEVPWRQHRRPMYERMVDEPRLTAWYHPGEPWPHPVLGELASVLGARYRVELGNLGLNLYRDGADSVAWHGDRIGASVPEPVVAIVSVGAPRPFLLRPKGGGPSRSFSLGWGDLTVMGGRCQQEWDHAVPKVASAGPRLSIMFRQLDDRPPGSRGRRSPAAPGRTPLPPPPSRSARPAAPRSTRRGAARSADRA